MATLLFEGFDASLSAAQGTGPTSWATFAKLPGIFSQGGVVAQNQVTAGDHDYFSSGRTANSTAWGKGTSMALASATTMVAFKRSTWSIGDEMFVSFDLGVPTAVGTTSVNTDYRQQCFRCGDIVVGLKSSTLVVTTYTLVFHVRNNGTEVTTVTVPNVSSGDWLFCKIACKLHASTGYITVEINGVAQAAAYTGQNTVTTNAAASTGTTQTADHVWCGPTTANVGSGTFYVGSLDNVCFDSAAVPTHRPRGERIALGSSSTDVNASAVGTGATTIANALDNPTDAKAARFTGAAASSIIDLASYSTSGIESALIGFNIYCKRVARRDQNQPRKLSLGLDISGVQTMGTIAANTTLEVSTVTTPPNTDYGVQGLNDVIYGASVTTSNLSNVKVRLLTS